MHLCGAMRERWKEMVLIYFSHTTSHSKHFTDREVGSFTLWPVFVWFSLRKTNISAKRCSQTNEKWRMKKCLKYLFWGRSKYWNRQSLVWCKCRHNAVQTIKCANVNNLSVAVCCTFVAPHRSTDGVKICGLPWFSYHGADAVPIEGTVLW